MSMRSLLIPAAAVVLLAGCVTVPTGPAVRVMPGSGKSFDQFRADDLGCRQYADSVIGGPNASQAAANNAAGQAVVGSAIGAAAGAIIGSVTGQAGAGAAIGAGTGLLVGSGYGANSAGYSSYTLQRDYDTAYLQCMYAHGNQIPGRVASRAPVYYAPPPNYPPPNYPPPNYPPPAAAPGSYPPPGTAYPPPGYPAPSSSTPQT
jgi:hypothetical protein